MPIIKRNGIWYVDIRAASGKRIRRSTGTEDKQKAQELHDKLKHELWRNDHLDEKPNVLWDTAALRWLKEMDHKKSIRDDLTKVRRLENFRGLFLKDLSKQFILSEIDKLDVSKSTKNRYLAFIRSVLNKCVDEWEWLESAPKLKLYKEAKKRVRWLHPHEVHRLLKVLPDYMADLVVFSLCTGLRKSNVLELSWSQVDLKRRVAWYYADETKSGAALGVALNDVAMAVLDKQMGKHPIRVFVNTKGRPVSGVSSRIWKNALIEAGIQNFRWHDLRHTWASWWVQKGVPIYALQEMGGWESIAMVQRYAHLAPEHLHQHADQITNILSPEDGHKLGTPKKGARHENSLDDCLGYLNLVPVPRVELGTF